MVICISKTLLLIVMFDHKAFKAFYLELYLTLEHICGISHVSHRHRNPSSPSILFLFIWIIPGNILNWKPPYPRLLFLILPHITICLLSTS
jgi:hypothetical protein